MSSHKKRRRSPLDSLGTKGKATPAKRDIPVTRALTARAAGDGRNPFKLNHEGQPIPGVVGADPRRSITRSRKRSGGGSGGGSRPILAPATLGPELKRPPNERTREIVSNVRGAIADGREGKVPPIPREINELHDGLAEALRRTGRIGPFSEAANLIRTYAGGRATEELPLRLRVSLVVHFRVWLLLMVGAAQKRLDLWYEAIELMQKHGTRKLLEEASAFMNWQIDQWERPEHRRDVMREFISHVHQDVPSKQVATTLTKMGHPITSGRVRQIRRELGIT